MCYPAGVQCHSQEQNIQGMSGFITICSVVKHIGSQRCHLQAVSTSQRRGSSVVLVKAAGRTVVIGLAADSGCGKSTFMRRMTSVFGGSPKPPAGDTSALASTEPRLLGRVLPSSTHCLLLMSITTSRRCFALAFHERICQYQTAKAALSPSKEGSFSRE